MRLIKIFFWLLFLAVFLFLFWFMPKYAYIRRNPGFCVQLVSRLYFCGEQSGMNDLFKK